MRFQSEEGAYRDHHTIDGVSPARMNDKQRRRVSYLRHSTRVCFETGGEAMPIKPTYPGIYIQELPSSAHSITAAPTSITVFVGYTHPFKTQNWGKAIQIFSPTDYEREFGGFFSSKIFDNDSANFGSVAHAVNQFFLNGGGIAYVIGLQAHYRDPSNNENDEGAIVAAALTVGGIVFTARELVDDKHPMLVTINNLQASNPAPGSPQDTADITIVYGSQAEVYRRVTINPNPTNPADKPNFIENRIGTTGNPISSLVTVSPGASGYGTTITATSQTPLAYTSPPNANWNVFSPADFGPVFQQDSSLDKLSIFNLLVLPGVTNSLILNEAIAFCERKQAFLIMDPPSADVADQGGSNWIGDYMTNTSPKSQNAALYFPYIVSTDPLTGASINLPPGGTVAGIYARTDNNRGVWKAPAGLETTVVNTTGVVETGRMNDMRQGTLNPLGVNCLRDFPGIGTVVFGARTSVTQNPAFEQWRYIPVRRMALFIEQTLYRNLGWVVFEPNDEPLWVTIRASVGSFMLSLFQQGAFQGDTPSKAFQVKCDSSTTTQNDIDQGIVNIIVAFAPLKPAEFVIVKIAQLAGQLQTA
jgi:phage tail sheath protein FI